MQNFVHYNHQQTSCMACLGSSKPRRFSNRFYTFITHRVEKQDGHRLCHWRARRWMAVKEKKSNILATQKFEFESHIATSLAPISKHLWIRCCGFAACLRCRLVAGVSSGPDGGTKRLKTWFRNDLWRIFWGVRFQRTCRTWVHLLLAEHLAVGTSFQIARTCLQTPVFMGKMVSMYNWTSTVREMISIYKYLTGIIKPTER